MYVLSGIGNNAAHLDKGDCAYERCLQGKVKMKVSPKPVIESLAGYQRRKCQSG